MERENSHQNVMTVKQHNKYAQYDVSNLMLTIPHTQVPGLAQGPVLEQVRNQLDTDGFSVLELVDFQTVQRHL